MDLKSAVMERVSRRSYELDPISGETKEKLEAAIWECNRSAGLDIRMKIDDGDAFSPSKSYGMLSGVSNYFAMLCGKDDPVGDEKIGYYGESLVLLATRLGLGTCWVGSTFEKDLCHVDVPDDEEFKIAIVFGHVKNKESVKERAIAKTVKRKSKEIKDILTAYDDVPNWVVDGARYVVKAPSAQNRQPVKILCDGDSVIAKVKGDHKYDHVDLGIAKLHFEIGADGGTWQFGNGGQFTKNE